MKTKYNVEPRLKKSVYEYNFLRKEMPDKTFYYATLETGWRWGKFQVSLDADEVKQVTDTGRIELTECEDFEMLYCDDGCWSDWSFSANTPESVKEDVIEIWAENGWSGLEENDWVDYDIEFSIDNGVVLEKAEDDS
jgi:hypothetical protein